jgi:hypothetical protein
MLKKISFSNYMPLGRWPGMEYLALWVAKSLEAADHVNPPRVDDPYDVSTCGRYRTQVTQKCLKSLSASPRYLRKTFIVQARYSGEEVLNIYI